MSDDIYVEPFDRKAYAKQYREKNKKYFEEYRKQWRIDNPNYQKLWLDSNVDYLPNWHLSNPHKRTEYARLNRLHPNHKPKWAFEERIHVIYQRRDELNAAWGTNFEVDHIVPLRGKTVCGLHCEDNLQLLDKPLNSSKRHFTWPDKP